MDTSKIIYSINIEDVQNVAEEEFGRKLAEKELEIIEDKIGDYIDWYSAIDTAMQNEVLHCNVSLMRRQSGSGRGFIRSKLYLRFFLNPFILLCKGRFRGL